jgi:hypothetical protein
LYLKAYSGLGGEVLGFGLGDYQVIGLDLGVRSLALPARYLLPSLLTCVYKIMELYVSTTIQSTVHRKCTFSNAYNHGHNNNKLMSSHIQ